MIYRFSLKQFFGRVLTLIGCLVVVGLLFDQLLLVLLCGAVITLIWNYQHLLKLINWLWQKNLISPPESHGVWGHIYDGIYRRTQKYRRKQRELNARIRKFRDGAEALPDAAIVLDLDYCIRWCNKKATSLLGIRWPLDNGQRITNLVRSPELANYVGKQDFSSPCSLESPDNEDQQLELRFMPYGEKQLLLLARDVSQLHRVEKMRRDFIANVSHELKTPLTVVRGYVEMIQEDNDFSDHWSRSFDTIEQQVTRMDRLVQQLLILSRVEVSGDSEIRTMVNIPHLISALVEDASVLNKNKQHRMSFDIDETLGVMGNESELKSAFANLLVNAINYTSDGGEIQVSWQRIGDHCVYQVCDTGDGIRPEDIDRLTERFYRVDKSRSRNTGGTGLGLAIVKHVAQHHNAQLHIESILHKGSTFRIEFPAEDSFILGENYPHQQSTF
ncbi:phosphate regulon sensor histidine kinase PhoR [Thalassotalea litorea]|uniref:Phosphate regulon sensor protein PhoR n=1 Tax=Thalassotalea litorea TaxID=2020715 RepID=A0A5R9II06_9GAMM|nr:phosphate regulon sensor histidine kinase PhoR [Thalassotalea litorea]TLU65145.1 phosphate regulon sensor histidine kinase PhoR [Thalassotalea litorea]